MLKHLSRNPIVSYASDTGDDDIHPISYVYCQNPAIHNGDVPLGTLFTALKCWHCSVSVVGTAAFQGADLSLTYNHLDQLNRESKTELSVLERCSGNTIGALNMNEVACDRRRHEEGDADLLRLDRVPPNPL
jgi:hypothetical protein